MRSVSWIVLFVPDMLKAKRIRVRYNIQYITVFLSKWFLHVFIQYHQGDSGGPLMVEREDGRWSLVGTVSHGIRCAYPNMPGVYMRMTYYRPWIERVTGIGGSTLG